MMRCFFGGSCTRGKPSLTSRSPLPQRAALRGNARCRATIGGRSSCRPAARLSSSTPASRTLLRQDLPLAFTPRRCRGRRRRATPSSPCRSLRRQVTSAPAVRSHARAALRWRPPLCAAAFTQGLRRPRHSLELGGQTSRLLASPHTNAVTPWPHPRSSRLAPTTSSAS